jgi:hypothetical protein
MADGETKKKAGRPKGAPNKITLDLIQTLKDKGFDPAAELVKCHAEAMKLYRTKVKQTNSWGAGPALDIAQRCASDLMEYVYPKRKSVELSGADGQDLFQSLTQMFKNVVDNK